VVISDRINLSGLRSLETVIAMLWSLIAQIVQVILDVLSLRLVTDPDKDLELVVLRQQVRVVLDRLHIRSDNGRPGTVI